MGKTKNSGLGVGTSGSPQGSIVQNNVNIKIENLIRKNMLKLLDIAGVKYNPDNVLFVIKDISNQLIWLESGDENVGLFHIKARHSREFQEKYGIKSENIAEYLKSFITTGKLEYSIIVKKNGNEGYERLYSKNGKYYLLTGVGKNGFLVSAYPVKEKTAKTLIKRNTKWKKK